MAIIDYSTFGTSQQFQVAGGLNVPAEISMARGEWNAPTSWAVMLGFPKGSRFFPSTGYPLNPPFGVYFDHGALFAIVEWGFGGTSFEAEVDWRMGTNFSVYGTWCRVRAVLPNDPTVPTGPSGEGLTVQAAVMPQACVAKPSAYRTVDYGDLGAAAVTNLYVPAYAEEAMLLTNGGTGVTAEVEWGEGGPAPVVTNQIVVAATANRNVADVALWTPVPYNANWCGVRNTTAGTLTDCKIVYRLGL